MTGYFTHERLANDTQRRAEFFSLHDKLIQRLKKMGRLEAAAHHVKIRNELRDYLSLLD